MSAFDEIAHDHDFAPSSPPDLVPSEDTTTDSSRFYRALLRVGDLVLNAGNKQPRSFVKVLRQACLDEACRETMLQLSGEEAQVVVDAIQLTLDELRLGDEFYRHALYLLVKLASNSNILPTSLFVSGVDIGAVRDPIHGGGFADIYQGRFEGMDVAVKKLRFHGGDRDQLHHAFCREALVWRQLNHPNVLPFIGVDADTFMSTNHMCMVSPWMSNGTLANYVSSDHYSPDNDCNRLLCEISCGLVYLHSQKVVHGDIHAANIFINIEGRAQVADFGLAVVGDITVGRLSSMGGAGGHLRYMAPERVSPSSPDSRRTSAADVYSFACICVFLYTGRQPFPHLPMEITVMFHIINGGRQSRPQRGECLLEMKDEMWNIITGCWSQDPTRRPSMAMVEEGLTRLAGDSDEQSLRRRRSYSSRHRLSHREVVRLSVTIPPVPDVTDHRPSTPTGSLRSPSVYSLSRATPIKTEIVSFSTTDDMDPTGSSVATQAVSHVRIAAQSGSTGSPSSPQDDSIMKILSALDGDPTLALPSVQTPNFTTRLTHGRAASATMLSEAPSSHPLELPSRPSRNSLHRRSTSAPLLPLFAPNIPEPPYSDSLSFPRTQAFHSDDCLAHESSEEEVADDIMEEALRWGSPMQLLPGEKDMATVVSSSKPKKRNAQTNRSPLAVPLPTSPKRTNLLLKFWRFGKSSASSKARERVNTAPSTQVMRTERTLTPAVQRLIHGDYLFRAKAVHARRVTGEDRMGSTTNKLSFERNESLIVTRVEEGLWQARKPTGEEGAVLPIYLEPEVLFRANFRANQDDVFLVDVLGVHNIWWYINALGNVISRVHSSRMSFDASALTWEPTTVYHAYTPEAGLLRHLAVDKYDEVVTQAEHVGEWTVARITYRHSSSVSVSNEIGLLPTWVFALDLQL